MHEDGGKERRRSAVRSIAVFQTWKRLSFRRGDFGDRVYLYFETRRTRRSTEFPPSIAVLTRAPSEPGGAAVHEDVAMSQRDSLWVLRGSPCPPCFRLRIRDSHRGRILPASGSWSTSTSPWINRLDAMKQTP